MSFDIDEKEFYETFAEFQENEGIKRALGWVWSTLDCAQKELRERDKENDELLKHSDVRIENLPKPHEAGKPSELAQRVTEAFRLSAADAVAVNLTRGNTVVGEVDGEWMATRDERAAVVAHLRERAVHAAGNVMSVEDACTILADLFERGEHRREERVFLEGTEE